MSTAAVTPAAPAAVSTPAPAAPATPTTPAVSTPEASTPSVTPESAAPVTATPAVGKPEPKPEDFPDDPSGVAFTKAHFAWQDEQSGVPAEVAPTEEVPAEVAPEATEEEQPAELGEPQDLPEEPESLTPESLNGLLNTNESLKAALEADPKAKGQLFEMARQNAKAKDLMAIFPNAETAKFANETANRTVAIKAAYLQAAEDPAKIGDAFEMFANEFREYDDKGQPAVDAQGNPVFGPDFEAHANYIVSSYHDGEIAELEAGLAAGQFKSERAKENAETLLQAYKFIKAAKDADPADFDRPDTSEMSPEGKAYFDQKEAEIKAEQEKLGLREKQQNSQERQAARKQANETAARTTAQEVYKRIDDIVEELRTNRVNIPDFAVKAINPANKLSYFGTSVYGQLLKESKTNPKLQSDLAILEAKPPTEENTNQRVEYFRQFANERLPIIVKREIATIQKSMRGEREAAKAKADAARAGVQPEPRAGSAVKPSTMTWDKAVEQAKVDVAKETEGRFLSDGDLYELQMKKAQRLMR